MPCFTTPKQLYNTCHTRYRIWTSKWGTLSSCLHKIISRLNHFNFRLRPVGLRPSCLTFGVTSACPMFTIRWLTYLAGTGLTPVEIIDLARPHTPVFSTWLKFLSQNQDLIYFLFLKLMKVPQSNDLYH
jgi:hypothetical protein